MTTHTNTGTEKVLPASLLSLIAAQPGATQSEAAASIAAGFELGNSELKVLTLAGADGEPDGVPFGVVGGRVVSLKEFQAPRLGAMRPDFTDASSFVSYVNRHKDQNASVIFAQLEQDGGKFQAYLDFPAAGKVSHREHVATFEATPTDDWEAVRGIANRKLTQDALAEFVEKYRHMFREPKAADMLELVRNVQGKKDGAFKFGRRLQTGDREIIWQEQTQFNTAAGEALTIPEKVTVHLVLFEGTEAASVHFLFRVRVEHGAVSFALEFLQVEAVVREVLKEVHRLIRDETVLPVYMGTAPAAPSSF